MCLPKECGKQDVKIITGYYWFWLKCGHIIAPESGGGGGPGFVGRYSMAADLHGNAQGSPNAAKPTVRGQGRLPHQARTFL